MDEATAQPLWSLNIVENTDSTPSFYATFDIFRPRFLATDETRPFLSAFLVGDTYATSLHKILGGGALSADHEQANAITYVFHAREELTRLLSAIARSPYHIGFVHGVEGEVVWTVVENGIGDLEASLERCIGPHFCEYRRR